MAKRSPNSIFRFNQAYRPGRSIFDLSHNYHTTMEFGRLYPVLVQEVYPGDYVELGMTGVVRMQPSVAPSLDSVTLYEHAFFVANRLIFDDWETFITNGRLGTTIVDMPRWPRGIAWTQAESDYWRPILGYDIPHYDTDIGSLWDAVGLPIRIGNVPLRYDVHDLVRRAYVQIWNDYYRDENLIEEIPIEDPQDGTTYYPMRWLLPRAWHKDYFTSALPFQQRGVAPAIPLTGIASAVWERDLFGQGSGQVNNFSLFGQRSKKVVIDPGSGTSTPLAGFTTNTASANDDMTQLWNMFNANSIDLSRIGTFTIPDLRLAYSLQLFQELQARGGSRYTETIITQFGVHNKDYRLQRPEYIGGAKMPIVISEVVQTSGAIGGTPQGNMAGHGLGVSGQFCGRYRVYEHGYIIALVSIMPESGYQQGIPRHFSRLTSTMFYWPVLSHLSEQAIMMQELYVPRFSQAQVVEPYFGFQGRFNELRSAQNLVTGQMRVYADSDYNNANPVPPAARRVPASLSYWNFTRYFASEPRLSWEFMLCRPRLDNFVVQNEPPFIVSIRNNIKAVRPLPYMPVPGWS